MILPRLISGQTCPKAKPISYYQVKTACQSVVGRLQHEHDTSPDYIRVTTRDVFSAFIRLLPTFNPTRGSAIVAVEDAHRDDDSRGAVPWREFAHYSAGAPVWHNKEEFSPARCVWLRCSFRWIRDCVCCCFPLGSRMNPPNQSVQPMRGSRYTYIESERQWRLPRMADAHR